MDNKNKTHTYLITKVRRGDAWATTINTSAPAPHPGFEECEHTFVKPYRAPVHTISPLPVYEQHRLEYYKERYKLTFNNKNEITSMTPR